MKQHYIGRKIIEAQPCNRQATGVQAEVGYSVTYADGYTSWSPKAAFEESYLPLGNIGHLPPFHQRLIGEFALLSKDYEKLDLFLAADVSMLDTEALTLLSEQSGAMSDLLGILAARLGLLGTPVGQSGKVLLPAPIMSEATKEAWANARNSLTPEEEQRLRDAGPGGVQWAPQPPREPGEVVEPASEPGTLARITDDGAVNSAGLTATEIQQREAGGLDELARIAGIDKRVDIPEGGVQLDEETSATAKTLEEPWMDEASKPTPQG